MEFEKTFVTIKKVNDKEWFKKFRDPLKSQTPTLAGDLWEDHSV